MLDIISIGDATIDTFLFVRELDIREEGGSKKAVMNWGDKLPVDKLYRTVAGNAANFAVGSSRLGLNAAFYSVLAHDTGGREIVHKMEKEGVSTRYIIKNDKHGTNASTVLSYKGERTIFVYHEHRKYDLPNFTRADWVYLTSMGEGFKKIYKDLASYIDKYDVKVGFNPGTFQLRVGPEAHKEILERTDVLSLNMEEAQSWVGEDLRDPEELCKRLTKLGPKAIALTDGRRGAYSYSDEGFYYIEEFPGERIEATGAGDSFTTAYIAALVYGLPHSEALRWGPVNAGSVVRQIGPQAGLLTRKEIEVQLKKRKNFQPIRIDSEEIKKEVLKMVSKKKD
ncbi:MAG: carbohydrate kinase family protein [Candidatus Doudnabacteria bacterium]|nr:carbohydrate kinase family protein [Candidatus Doudnabacteria bacterium]